jgi:hypothetical protein
MTLVSSRMPSARLAMRFQAAGNVHRPLKSLAVGLIKHPVSTPKHLGAN